MDRNTEQHVKSPKKDDWDALTDVFSALMESAELESLSDSEDYNSYTLGRIHKGGKRKFGEMNEDEEVQKEMAVRAAFNRKPHEGGEFVPGMEICEFVLAFYNKNNKGVKYEFKKLLAQIPYGGVGQCSYHINFFACQSGSSGSSPVLFFADVSFDKRVSVDVCCILDPNPYSDGDFGKNVMYHPPFVKCTFCAEMCEVLNNLDSDDSDIEI